MMLENRDTSVSSGADRIQMVRCLQVGGFGMPEKRLTSREILDRLATSIEESTRVTSRLDGEVRVLNQTLAVNAAKMELLGATVEKLDKELAKHGEKLEKLNLDFNVAWAKTTVWAMVLGTLISIGVGLLTEYLKGGLRGDSGKVQQTSKDDVLKEVRQYLSEIRPKPLETSAKASASTERVATDIVIVMKPTPRDDGTWCMSVNYIDRATRTRWVYTKRGLKDAEDAAEAKSLADFLSKLEGATPLDDCPRFKGVHLPGDIWRQYSFAFFFQVNAIFPELNRRFGPRAVEIPINVDQIMDDLITDLRVNGKSYFGCDAIVAAPPPFPVAPPPAIEGGPAPKPVGVSAR